jgi:hypothetical protein
MKLPGLVPNSYIHVSVSDLYIPRIGLPIWLQQNRQTDPGKYKLLTNTWMWKLGDKTLWICSGNNEAPRSFISGNTWFRIKHLFDSHMPFICSACMRGPGSSGHTLGRGVQGKKIKGTHCPRKKCHGIIAPNRAFKCLSRGKYSVSVFERPLNRAKSPPFWNGALKT